MSLSHLQAFGVQHFGVFREVHLHAAVLADGHGQFLQSSVPAVRTEHSVHVARCPEIKTFTLQ